MSDEQTLEEPRQQQPRQLAHDVKFHLLVVSMGMEVLKGERDNADQFASAYETIRQDGVEPLKRMVVYVVRLACKQQE